ncbi:MAG: hypothetical protein DHS20C15_13390 [Planctomycetota bacterium]|nr:MAG: hypothetical protein DHS20C15_13390 [Planctomycetota bacterium]
MNSSRTNRRPRLTVPAAALALLSLLAGGSSAQSHYGMSEEGRLGWNGTVLNNLSGDFDSDMSGSAFFFTFTSSGTSPFGSGLNVFLSSGSFLYFSSGSSGFFFFLAGDSDFEVEDYYERWSAHVILGPDRWSLRADGRISRNGKKFAQLPSYFLAPDWIALDVVDDVSYALRRDGVLTTGEAVSVKFFQALSFFTSVAGWQGAGAAMRADGALFTPQDTLLPLLQFHGGLGQAGTTDGETLDTVWVDTVVHPETGDLYALRRDGVVMRGVITPESAFTEEVARLPPSFYEAGEVISLRRLTYPSPGSYADIEILASGDWVVLRGDGVVFAGSSPLAPGNVSPGSVEVLVDYDGGNVFDTIFCDLAVNGDHFQAIRYDGKIFRDFTPEKFLNMPGEGYTDTFFVDEAPNLDAFKNNVPSVSRYRTTLLAGDPATTVIPVLPVDIDKAADELVVSVISELPEGVSWDPVARAFSVAPQAEPGRFKLRVSVDDGVTPKPKRFKFPVRVRPLDLNTKRNRKPTAGKIGGTLALVGIETVLPLIPIDRDGDSVTITPILDQGLFALPGSNASYDDSTRELRWLPELEHVGKQFARFWLDDGTVKRKFRVKLKVKAPLLGLLPADG